MSDEMIYAIGKYLHATVDGLDCVIYKSLTCEGKGDRRMSCWRYAAPNNTEVDKDAKVVTGEYVDTTFDVPFMGLRLTQDE